MHPNTAPAAADRRPTAEPRRGGDGEAIEQLAATLDQATQLIAQATALLTQAASLSRALALHAAANGPARPRVEWITVEEAARRYPIGEHQLRDAIRTRRIRALILSGPKGKPRYRLRPEIVEEFHVGLEQPADLGGRTTPNATG